jgi:diguanylate cyclase (GGDEF)-like protein
MNGAGILVLSLAAALAGCAPAPQTESRPPEAHAGVLDLRRLGLEDSAPVSLEGAWVFYWRELIPPAALPSAPPGRTLALPSSWNAAGLGGDGFGTHVLRIQLPPGKHDLALQFGEIMSASRLWVDGALVLERGTVGRSPEEEVPDTRPGFVRLVGAEGTLEVVLQISNHFHFEGGPVHPFRLGRLEAVDAAVNRSARLDYLLIGCTGIVCVFFGFLFVARPSEPTHLLYSLVALVLMLRVATANWHVLDVFPWLGPYGQLRLDYFTFFSLPALYWSFMARIFPGEFPRRMGMVFVSLAAVGLLSLPLPPRLFTLLREPAKAVAVVVVLATLLCILRAAVRQREGSWLLAGVGALTSVAVVWDVIERPRYVAGSRDLFPATLVVLVAAHAAILGRRLSRSLNTSEQLANELRNLNQSLEQRVAERTADLERMATTDPLTGLNNRRSLLRLADLERTRAARLGQGVAVLLMDVDHFKGINDAHGHAVGDEVLRVLARALTLSLREYDVVGRYGGDEFVVVLPVADADEGREAAERVRAALDAARVTLAGGQTAGVTVSVGFTLARRAETLDQALDRADRALYAAKEAGRNRVAFEPSA